MYTCLIVIYPVRWILFREGKLLPWQCIITYICGNCLTYSVGYFPGLIGLLHASQSPSSSAAEFPRSLDQLQFSWAKHSPPPWNTSPHSLLSWSQFHSAFDHHPHLPVPVLSPTPPTQMLQMAWRNAAVHWVWADDLQFNADKVEGLARLWIQTEKQFFFKH